MREGEIFRRAYVAQIETIEAAGLTVDFKLGPREWKLFMQSHAEHRPYISTSFNGGYNTQIGMHNSASFICYDGNGTSVAGIMLRSYPQRLSHLIEHAGLWMAEHDVLLSEFVPDPAIYDRVPEAVLSARVSQRGGLFVSPAVRGRGVGSALSRLSLAAAFRLFDHDVCVGLRKEDHDPQSAHIAYLGKAEIGTPCLPFYLTWESRDEALARFMPEQPGNVVKLDVTR